MTKYIHMPTGDEVQLEKWRWEAYYLDGTCIKQFDILSEELGEYHQFHEIDQNNLHVFKMVDGNGSSYALLFNPYKARVGAAKLVHKYRGSIKVVERVNADGSVVADDPITAKSYLFGHVVDGKGSFIVIAHTGEVIMTDDPDLVNLEIRTQEVQ